jgi:aspartyl-tRNA(Asn)/glutamyl-tRNA(Gln) amidotransferase subunit B
VPIAPSREWVERLRAELPELPAARRRRILAQHGFTPEQLRDMTNAGVTELVLETVDAGASPAKAAGWWLGYLVGKANEAGVDAADLAVTPSQVARVAALEDDGSLTNRLARQAVDAVLAGEGDVDEVVERRGLEVADESVLVAAVDDAIAAQPAVAERIRAGNVAAVGALIGSVMKATGGQADARRARELILARLGSDR